MAGSFWHSKITTTRSLKDSESLIMQTTTRDHGGGGTQLNSSP